MIPLRGLRKNEMKMSRAVERVRTSVHSEFIRNAQPKIRHRVWQDLREGVTIRAAEGIWAVVARRIF